MKTKILQKIFLLCFTICSFVLLSSSAFAADLSILRPGQNEKVSGSHTVGWSVYNTGLPSVPFEIRVKNSSCSDTGIAIAGNNFSSTVQNGTYNQSWNTASVSDGLHCLQVCILLDGGNVQCTHRIFNVVNYSNNAPIITSYPSDLHFNTNEVFEYWVQAHDPDGDLVIYKLLSAPDFIFLDQNGRMGLGNYMKVGSYNIAFAAIDSEGAATQQSFVLNVSASPTPIPTKVPSNPSPTKPASPVPTTVPEEPQPEVTEEPGEEGTLVITAPDGEAIFSADSNTIAWEATGVDLKTKSIVIEYSPDNGISFYDIKRDSNAEISEINWDVTDLENGEYLIRIRLLDEEENTVANSVSESFLIGNKIEEGKVLSVLSLIPENKQEITDVTPIISATFVPSDDAEIEIDSVVIKLDGKKITDDCSINEDGFECEITKELDIEEHSIEIEMEDSNGQTLNQSWIFYVEEEKNDDPIDEDDPTPTPEESGGGFNLDGIDTEELQKFYPFCGGILLILVLVVVISMLKKRKEYSSYSTGDNAFSDPTPSPTNDFGDFAATSEGFDFSVGNHDVTPEDVTPVVEQVNIVEETEDVPDWLKGDSASSSQPVGTSPLPAATDGSEGARVHESFGLTPTDQG